MAVGARRKRRALRICFHARRDGDSGKAPLRDQSQRRIEGRGIGAEILRRSYDEDADPPLEHPQTPMARASKTSEQSARAKASVDALNMLADNDHSATGVMCVNDRENLHA